MIVKKQARMSDKGKREEGDGYEERRGHICQCNNGVTKTGRSWEWVLLEGAHPTVVI